MEIDVCLKQTSLRRHLEFPGHIWCSSQRFRELNPIDCIFTIAIVDKESHFPCHPLAFSLP